MADTVSLARSLGLEVEVNLVPVNGENVKGDVATGKYRPLSDLVYLAIHETSNPNPGTDARMHRQFVANGGGAEGVSFNWCVDSKRAVQILPDTAYNVAQKNGNSIAASIETCVNRDGDWPSTLDNLAKLIVAFTVAYNMSVDKIKPHFFFTGKNCPAIIRSTPGGWDSLIASVEKYRVMLVSVPPKPVEPDKKQVRDFAIKGKSTISKAVFDTKLKSRQSPIITEVPDAYEIIESYGINPAVALWIFGKDSEFGTYEHGTSQTQLLRAARNPGNLRPVAAEYGKPGSLATDVLDIGPPYRQFAVYDTWRDGLSEWCRYMLRRYVSQGINTVSAAIAIYAPKSDGNDPVKYAEQVNEWIEKSARDSGIDLDKHQSRVSDLVGLHAPNARLADIAGGMDSFFNQVAAMGASWVKLLYPDHNRADATAAKNRGLRVIVRAPGEGYVHVSDVQAMIAEFNGVCEVIEVGNEPAYPEDEANPLSLWQHAWYLERVWQECSALARENNIILCTPGWRGNDPVPGVGRFDPALVDRLISVYAMYPARACHAYGDYVLEMDQVNRIRAWAAMFGNKPIYLTEVGIASRDLIDVPPDPTRFAQSEFLKAQRYADFAKAVSDNLSMIQAIIYFLGSGGTQSWSGFNPGRESEFDTNGILGYWLSDAAWLEMGKSLE